MNLWMSRKVALAVTAVFTLMGTGALAQGVTGAAVTGTVQAEGQPVKGASVQLRNTATGETFSATTGNGGAYFVDNVPAGGPYVLTVTQNGIETAIEQDIQLALGERRTVNFGARASFGEEIAVVAHNDALADRSRSGPSTKVKSQTITALPLQGRNFTDLVRTDARVTGSGSFAGQNDRYNNIQIDGGANNDLFGLGTLTPGSNAGAKPLSIEAIQEFVIQVAPFDVRLGNFAGGLVNAVTKSGTNEFHGSLFGYEQNKVFAGNQSDPTFLAYNTTQYGATLSGPIVKDKAHFFIATDIQSRQSSFGDPSQITGVDAADQAAAGFTIATANRFIDILKTKYNINAGNALAPSLGSPDRNLFIKVDTNTLPNSRLELSYNLVSANSDNLARDPTGTSVPNGLRGGYELSGSGYNLQNLTNTVRAKLTTNSDDGVFSNELLGGVSIIRDVRQPSSTSPLIFVKAGAIGSADSYLAAGAERFSQANSLDQNVYQVQDNLTFSKDEHRLTFGTSNEFLNLKNTFLQAATGIYAFDSLDAFAAGTPNAFERRLPVYSKLPDGTVGSLQAPGVAAFTVSQLGVYLQDEWTVASHLTLTPGIRLDVPFLSKAVSNPALVNNTAFPLDTGKLPSGNLLWSPRIGFNYDVDGNNDTVLRGGAGVFTGRPPYVFVSNAYGNNGLASSSLLCVPAKGSKVLSFPFNPDPTQQPTDCSGGTGTPLPPTNQGEIDYFDPNTKYPQNFRLAAGVDHRLPFGLNVSADFLYTRDINAFYTSDENLVQQGYDGDGRALYGSRGVNPANGRFVGTPTRKDPVNLRQAIEVFNKEGGHVTTASLTVTRQFARRYTLSASYAYSRSLDRMSFTSSQAFSNFQFSPLDGELENRAVRPSAFDRPHKITVSGNAALPYGFVLGIIYVGQSGTPYTWTVNGDVNGDGVSGNDVPFIPANASQITLSDPTQYAALDTFIKGQSCLQDARGGLLKRGACRNPWQDFLDTRVSWTSPEFKGGQHFEVQYDIFNLLNLLNSDWGHFDQVASFETVRAQFLRAVGYDKVNNRPIYSFGPPNSITATTYSPTASRWRMQFGAKYVF